MNIVRGLRYLSKRVRIWRNEDIKGLFRVIDKITTILSQLTNKLTNELTNELTKGKGKRMTDKEKAIVMAHTGICMLSGDKFQIFHKYVEEIMGRPVYIHEMAIKAISDEIKEKSKADFIAICAEQEPKTGH